MSLFTNDGDTMSRRSHSRRWVGLLVVASLGCMSGQSAEKGTAANPNGLRIESKWNGSEVGVLVSEAQDPFAFSYELTNISKEAKEIRLTRISCGCAAVRLISGNTAKPLARGDAFTIGAHEHVTITLEVDLSRKPLGAHNFPIDLSIVRAGSEEPFSLPEPSVRIIADISADPPVLSHQFRWNDDPIVEKRLTITVLQRAECGERLPEPKLGRLPDYLILKELRKVESVKSGKYLTEKWILDFSMKKPITEDYTVASSIAISFPSSTLHTLSIPSVVTAKRGIEVRPQSLNFTSESAALHRKRCLLITATDSRPFSITRITTRSGLCRAALRESKTSVSHLIEVIPTSNSKNIREDTLEVETTHPDSPSIVVPVSLAD